ncbi:MAG: DNA-directed RNA polymerase subunit F [archaeon]
MVMKILKEEPVSLAEVKELLDGQKVKKDEEATYEQKQTIEYVKEFSKFKPAKVKTAIESLIALGINRKEAVKILDIAPQEPKEMKLIFSKVHYSISEDTTNKVLEIVRSLE